MRDKYEPGESPGELL